MRALQGLSDAPQKINPLNSQTVDMPESEDDILHLFIPGKESDMKDKSLHEVVVNAIKRLSAEQKSAFDRIIGKLLLLLAT